MSAALQRKAVLLKGHRVGQYGCGKPAPSFRVLFHGGARQH